MTRPASTGGTDRASPADVAFACARTFVDGLVRSGLEHVCVSPGSRSTPLALAFARDERVRVHVHLDERSSAFFALGIAKVSGRPAGVVCTSGTAAANLFPAVVEASMSRTPLLALTADRPPELRGVGANQTIDQRDLFGRYVRWHVDAPVPEPPAGAGSLWSLLAVEAFTRACAPLPGPVHVNLPYREPLVPGGHGADVGSGSFGTGATTGATTAAAGRPPVEDDLASFLDELRGVERGLLYAGTLRGPAPDIRALGAALGWPVIAEPTSGIRVPGVLAAGSALLADEAFAEGHVPEVVVQFGAAPTSRAALALTGRAGRLVIVDPDGLVADPHRRASRRWVVNAGDLAAAAVRRVHARGDGPWGSDWRAADEAARRAIDATIDAWEEPFEGRVARDVAAGCPDGTALVVGSSMPVRDLDAYMNPRHGLRVLANRGASGIDGFVSTALGVAATGVATTVLCGDLTLLHDVGALVWGARRGQDAVFVVPNNDGGVIFSFLEQRDLPELEELFTTPHGLDLGRVCEAAGAGHHRVERAGDLGPAIQRARTSGGVQVVEVPIDRESNVRRHGDVQEAVAVALRADR
ncbi:MAG TPA: 2-succinyl-5-enolpyruvyl-6-hydroxy-3-cyclohexene-1-carboxylic-acid synthase [Actinomycetota bacterium]|nr:2-succinyl-5-enolpyruvyl-6-hydroxy-3-cyclohexene-1-carboxylic-acid synthase [Actinomycetota bacterium]